MAFDVLFEFSMYYNETYLRGIQDNHYIKTCITDLGLKVITFVKTTVRGNRNDITFLLSFVVHEMFLVLVFRLFVL